MEYGGRSNAEHKLVWVAVFGAVGLLIMFVAYTFWPSVVSSTNVTIGPKTFYADVADTDEKRARGLTQLSALSEDRALLMIYDYDNVWPISTKGLKFDVDIVWLDNNKRVLYLSKNAQPSAMYRPSGKSRYVLQMPGGSITKYNITVGKQVKFDKESAG